MSDLRGMNTPMELNMGMSAKVIGALVVLGAIIAAGIYTTETGMWKAPAKQVVADSRLPAPSLPGETH